MFVRLMVSLASLAVLVAVMAPLPASARMHFTTTRERLEALAQRAQSSLALTNPTEIQTQVREMITQAQAAKAAAEETAQRPASNADDRTVLTTVGQEMDGVVASANRALTATGADQRTALQDVQTRTDRTLTAVRNRITAQLAQPAPSPSPGTLPASGDASAQVGAAPALWLAGFAALILGLGIWTRSRRRGES